VLPRLIDERPGRCHDHMAAVALVLLGLVALALRILARLLFLVLVRRIVVLAALVLLGAIAEVPRLDDVDPVNDAPAVALDALVERKAARAVDGLAHLGRPATAVGSGELLEQ